LSKINALQFTKLFGVRVIATTSSNEKAQRLKVLGTDEVINYRTTPDWLDSPLLFVHLFLISAFVSPSHSCMIEQVGMLRGE
jgi:D-arabinose 1-dehydrogenase-like Zn-dependent alcohol dehydrogenase